MSDKPKPVSVHTPKRTEAQKLKDMEDLSKLFLDGMHQRDMCRWIAANRPYTLSIGMVNRIIGDIVAMWEDATVANIGRIKARDLLQLAKVEKAASDAFERSLKQSEESSKATEEDADETKSAQAVEAKPEAEAGDKPKRRRKVRESKTTKNRDGDPRFLAIILDCVKQRGEILGYCKPKKLELSGEEGGPIKLDGSIEAALERAYGPKKPEPAAIPVTATVTTGPTTPIAEPPKDWRAVMAK